MRKILTLMVMLMILANCVYANKWQEPLELIGFDNVTWYGNGLRTSSGLTLLSWSQNCNGSPMVSINLFDEQMSPIWQTPIQSQQFSIIVETSDGAFISVIQENLAFRAYKFSSSGSHLWNPEGIVFHTWNNYTPMNLVLKADLCGGVYLGWTPDGTIEEFANLQHLDSSGSITMPTGGIIMDTSIENHLTDLLVLSDNTVLVSYIGRGFQKVKRINHFGEMVWTQELSIATPQPRFPEGKLCGITSDSFILAIAQTHYVTVQRYSYAGVPMWATSLDVLSGDMLSYTIEIMKASDNAVFIVAESWSDDALNMQKLSYNGEVLWGQNACIATDDQEIIWTANAGTEGDCYLSYTQNNVADIVAVHLSNTGSQLWAVNTLDTDAVSGQQHSLFSYYVNGTYRVLWMDFRQPQAGIYTQSFTIGGAVNHVANGIPVITGTRGYIVSSELKGIQDKVAVYWTQRNNLWDTSKLHFQLVSPNGQTSFGSEGIIISDEAMDYEERPQLYLAGNNLLILWKEYGDDEFHDLKAQLIDPTGNILWENQGKTIHSGYFSNARASYFEGSIFIAWQLEYIDYTRETYCQKYTDGIAQWQPAIQVSANNPNVDQDIFHLISFTGPYLLWETQVSPNTIWLKRIYQDGSTSEGFNPWGNQVSQSGYWFKSAELMGENILLSLQSPWFGLDSMILQFISPSGTLLWGTNGILTDYWSTSCAATSQNIYTASLEATLVFQKRNLAGELVWTQLYSIPGYIPSQTSISRIQKLADDCLAIFYHDEVADNILHYLYADDNGSFILPTENYLFDSTDYINYRYCSAQNAIYVSSLTGLNSDQILLQRLSHPSNPVQDEVSAPISLLTISASYPNPFRDGTTCLIDSQKKLDVVVAVYNLRGQLVRELHRGSMEKGQIQLFWDGKDSSDKNCASGVYTIKATSSQGSAIIKMVRL